MATNKALTIYEYNKLKDYFNNYVNWCNSTTAYIPVRLSNFVNTAAESIYETTGDSSNDKLIHRDSTAFNTPVTLGAQNFYSKNNIFIDSNRNVISTYSADKKSISFDDLNYFYMSLTPNVLSPITAYFACGVFPQYSKAYCGSYGVMTVNTTYMPHIRPVYDLAQQLPLSGCFAGANNYNNTGVMDGNGYVNTISNTRPYIIICDDTDNIITSLCDGKSKYPRLDYVVQKAHNGGITPANIRFSSGRSDHHLCFSTNVCVQVKKEVTRTTNSSEISYTSSINGYTNKSLIGKRYLVYDCIKYNGINHPILFTGTLNTPLLKNFLIIEFVIHLKNGQRCENSNILSYNTPSGGDLIAPHFEYANLERTGSDFGSVNTMGDGTSDVPSGTASPIYTSLTGYTYYIIHYNDTYTHDKGRNAEYVKLNNNLIVSITHPNWGIYCFEKSTPNCENCTSSVSYNTNYSQFSIQKDSKLKFYNADGTGSNGGYPAFGIYLVKYLNFTGYYNNNGSSSTNSNIVFEGVTEGTTVGSTVGSGSTYYDTLATGSRYRLYDTFKYARFKFSISMNESTFRNSAWSVTLGGVNAVNISTNYGGSSSSTITAWFDITNNTAFSKTNSTLKQLIFKRTNQ